MGRLSGIGETGLLDMSKDGRYGIDGYLQLYDLHSGTKVMSICGEHVSNDDDEADTDGAGLELCTLVRLTHDGKYAIWVDVSLYLFLQLQCWCNYEHKSQHVWKWKYYMKLM